MGERAKPYLYRAVAHGVAATIRFAKEHRAGTVIGLAGTALSGLLVSLTRPNEPEALQQALVSAAYTAGAAVLLVAVVLLLNIIAAPARMERGEQGAQPGSNGAPSARRTRSK